LIIIGGDKANDMGLPGLAAGDSKVEVSGNKVYIAGYTASETQAAANQVIGWLKENVNA